MLAPQRSHTNNYFRVGYGARAQYIFFDDTLEEVVNTAWTRAFAAKQTWLKSEPTCAIGVFRAPLMQGPWRAGAIVVFDRFGLDEGAGRLGNGEHAASEEGAEDEKAPKSGPVNPRSKLGPVLS